MQLTLEQMKKHLNVDFDDDDELIMDLGLVAEQAVERHIDVPLAHLTAKNGGTLPAPVIHAMLLMVGDLYKNRESTSNQTQHEVPLAYRYLLSLYCNYGGAPRCEPAH